MTNISPLSAIVARASQSYGSSIAAAFVNAGARVWITGRNASQL